MHSCRLVYASRAIDQESAVFSTIIQITQLRVRFYWFSILRGSERGRKYGIFDDLPISKRRKSKKGLQFRFSKFCVLGINIVIELAQL